MIGSGSSGVVALNLERRFVGIEIEPETFEIAKDKNWQLTDGIIKG